MCLGVPRHFDFYANLRLNSPRTLANYIPHDEGVYLLDRHMHRFNFPPRIGDVIIDWQYTPNNGIIVCKAHDVPYSIGDSDTVYAKGLAANLTSKLTVSQKKDGNVAISPNYSSLEHDSSNVDHTKLMKFSIDGNQILDVHRKVPAEKAHKVVPQIYFGILPTPQLNPANDNTNFQNTAAYYSVVAEIIVEYNCDSIYPYGLSPHCPPDEVVFPTRDIVQYDDINPIALESFGS